MSRNTQIMPDKKQSEQKQEAVVVNSRGAAANNNLRNIGLIIGREYKNRVAQRSFIISSIIMMVLIVLAASAPTIVLYFSSFGNTQTKIAVVNNAGSIANMSEGALTSSINTMLNGNSNQAGQNTSGKAPFAITVQSAQSVDGLRDQVKNGHQDILLVLDRAANQDLHFTYYTRTDATNDGNLSRVQGLAQQLNILDTSHRLGLTVAQTNSLFAPPVFNVVNTEPATNNRSAADIATGYIIAYGGIILIFMSVFFYGMSVATGVGEEKGSRIMEILINAATPFQLMAGKVVGIGAAGLTQMVCLVTVGIGALLLQNPLQQMLLGHGNGGINLHITSVNILPLVMLLVYFILGFTLFATLFAAMGALVKRQDEVQNATQPITWLFMIGYMVSYVGVYLPDATWMKVMSYVPFWTPTLMPVRLASGNVAWWEIPMTVVFMLIAIFVCTVISARIYRYGVLMYGQKPGLLQLVRLASAK